MKKIFQAVCYVLYVCFARYLPISYSRVNLGARWIRGVLARGIVSRAGRGINIERMSSFGTRLEIGDRAMLGINCMAMGPISIGDDVMIGPDVQMYTRNHRHDRIDVPMNQQGYEEYRKIVIERDVWIGARVIILPGVRIGEGSIVGAGSVVSRDVPPYAIVAGNPSRVVRMRKDNASVRGIEPGVAPDAN
jgi:maltose O-acetyltransferase